MRAQRLAAALRTQVAPHVEAELLQLARPPRCAPRWRGRWCTQAWAAPAARPHCHRQHRVVAHAGASYSATLALQTLLGGGGAAGGGAARATDALLLGSLDPLDPEIMQALETDAPRSPRRPPRRPTARPMRPPRRLRPPPRRPTRRSPSSSPTARSARAARRARRAAAAAAGQRTAGIPDAAHALAALSRRAARRSTDRTSCGRGPRDMKFPFVSRGLMWLARRARPPSWGTAPDGLALDWVVLYSTHTYSTRFRRIHRQPPASQLLVHGGGPGRRRLRSSHAATKASSTRFSASRTVSAVRWRGASRVAAAAPAAAAASAPSAASAAALARSRSASASSGGVLRDTARVGLGSAAPAARNPATRGGAQPTHTACAASRASASPASPSRRPACPA